MAGTWTNDEPMYGGWCTMPGAFSAEVMGAAGFDWCCVDLQHGMITRGDLVGMLQALAVGRTPAVVRVPWNHPPDIMWALDAGAEAVIVPMVDDAEQAHAAVHACRFAPTGGRSWGPTRVALHTGPGSPAEFDAAVRCIVMVESVAAVERLDEILAVPGVDGVFIGPNDLAVSMGIDPRKADPRHDDAVKHVLDRCRAAGVLPGIFCGTAERAVGYRDLGFRLLAVCSDVSLMRNAAGRALDALR